MSRRGAVAAIVAATVLLVSLAMLAAQFLATVDAATRHFDRAAISRAQFADVLAIRSAAGAGDRPGVAAALARYRGHLAGEERLIAPAARPGQRAERDDAARIARLALAGPSGFRALTAAVDTAARREQAEAHDTALAVEGLRARARLYAGLLTLTAALAAVAGAAALVLANRRLGHAVAERTARLLAVDRSRRLFFAKVSHELRTPVTVMRGEAEVALATARDDPAALAAALTDVIAESEQLDHRIADLLALSQAEDGRLVLADAGFDLADTVRHAAERGRRHAASHRVRLVCDAPDRVTMRGDARWIEQALVAVIDNAVKFSHPDGVVEIVLAAAPGAAILSVADRGIGVLPDALPRLFDSYYQTEAGRARGGSGLGLALVRWVVERHGGVVEARARDGGGCVVTMTLPVTA